MSGTEAGVSGKVWPEVKRVLIYRMGSLGDTVVAMPSLHLAARAFPNADRRMLTNFPVSAKAPAAAAVLGDSGLIRGFFRYGVGTRSPRELLSLWWKLRRWRPQVLVYLGPARGVAAAKRDALFFMLCGISWQVGVPVTEELQEHRFQPQQAGYEPECERLARTVAELGDARLGERGSWELSLTAPERARAAEVLAPAGERAILAVSLGTKAQANEWGKENWRGLLRALAEEYKDFALMLTGVEMEREVCDFAADGWREAAGPDAVVLNLCGQLSPREAAACFERSRLFLGHDSGPMHFAACVGTRVVAVFSSRNLPRIWYPHGEGHRVLYHRVNCEGCGLVTCLVERKKCILSIEVREVVEQVRLALAGTGTSAGF